MEQQVTNKGKKILSSIERRLGRSPSQEDMEAVHRTLEKHGFPQLSQGNTTRYVFVLRKNLVTGGGVVKLPRKDNDFWESYSLVHLGVDQNIRSIYTSKHLSDDGLAPPVISYSEVGSWVVFPIVEDLRDEHMGEFEQKADIIRSRPDVKCATQQEVSGTLDIDVPGNWGVYNGEVVLRDLGSVVVRKEEAPNLDLVADPYWES